MFNIVREDHMLLIETRAGMFNQNLKQNIYVNYRNTCFLQKNMQLGHHFKHNHNILVMYFFINHPNIDTLELFLTKEEAKDGYFKISLERKHDILVDCIPTLNILNLLYHMTICVYLKLNYITNIDLT
ncbi:hypothetical protein ACJX0J_019148 [Zea mays]